MNLKKEPKGPLQFALKYGTQGVLVKIGNTTWIKKAWPKKKS